MRLASKKKNGHDTQIIYNYVSPAAYTQRKCPNGLFCACIWDLKPIIERFLESGLADVNESFENAGAAKIIPRPRLPIKVAAFFGHYDIFKLLHQHGAPICNSLTCTLSYKQYEGTYHKHLTQSDREARIRGDSRLAVLHYIKRNCPVDWCVPGILYGVVFNGNARVVRICLAEKADPNWKGETGQTPLHCAAERGLCDIIEILLDHCANPFETDDWQGTPVEIALHNRNPDVLNAIAAYHPSWQRDARTFIFDYAYLNMEWLLGRRMRRRYVQPPMKEMIVNLESVGMDLTVKHHGRTMLDAMRRRLLEVPVHGVDAELMEYLEGIEGLAAASGQTLHEEFKCWKACWVSVETDDKLRRKSSSRWLFRSRGL